MWIDSHCHLNHSRFEGTAPEDIIADFKENQINGCVTISCRISDEFPEILKIAQIRGFGVIWMAATRRETFGILSLKTQ